MAVCFPDELLHNAAENIGRLFRTRFKGSQFIVVSLKDGLFSNANGEPTTNLLSHSNALINGAVPQCFSALVSATERVSSSGQVKDPRPDSTTRRTSTLAAAGQVAKAGPASDPAWSNSISLRLSPMLLHY